MKKVLIQLWEIQTIDSIISDGCSLHLNMSDRDIYISDLNKFENPVGIPSEVIISDVMYKIIQREKNIRLSEIEMNNLLGLKDIEIYDSI